MTLPSWDDRWMDVARLAATWSADRSRKVGAVIVNARNELVSLACNGFPDGVDANVECRHQRPAKYQWTEHAERNALYTAAANGTPTRGCSIYVPWYPCADCARAIVQSGLVAAIVIEPDWQDPVFASDFAVVRQMLSEAGIAVRFLPGNPPVAA